MGRQWETLGDKGEDKTLRTPTHHPTQAHMWGRDNGGKVETRYRTADTPTNKKEGRHWVGDEGRQDQGGHLKNALRTPRAVHCLEDKKGDNVERRGTKKYKKKKKR